MIRIMDEQDLTEVSAICMASFLASVADTLSEEGVVTFSKIASAESFLKRMRDDNVMLVAEVDGAIEGVIELKEARHIAMLFVRPERQREGIGRQLFLSIMNYTKTDAVTVRASLSSVPAYEKYGFECSGEAGVSAGLAYQPMELTRR